MFLIQLKIGFTGTQKGMTFDQKNNFLVTLRELNNDYHLTEFHHGDCMGSDAEAHRLVQIYFPHVEIKKHPPEDPGRRAYCEGGFCYTEKPYLVRNHEIVDDTDILIATPEHENEQLRSGTWATVRYAKLNEKKVTIISPNGDCKQ